VQVMTDVVRDIKKNGFTAKELTNKKAGYLTQYYIAQESNDAQALTLGVAELIKNWHYALEIKDMVQGLTLQDVNSAFNKYASAITWFYLGDETKMNKDIFLRKL
jgi:predicted Zn-dependent peptidase